jgi:hypothetical protein
MPDPIPTHLTHLEWYPPHQAWLRDQGLPHHDPGDAEPCRADLRGVDLSGVDLSGANLDGVDIFGRHSSADLTRADLTDSRLIGVNPATVLRCMGVLI